MRYRTKRDRIMPAKITLLLERPERNFVLCVGVLGMTASEAYRLCMETKASNASATAMASKLLRENRIQRALMELYRAYEAGRFLFNERTILY